MNDPMMREIDRAIHDAEHPSGMSVHDGMARISAATLRKLVAENDALREDAERLAWMIENQKRLLKFTSWWIVADQNGYHNGMFYLTAQAAIDAARSKTN